MSESGTSVARKLAEAEALRAMDDPLAARVLLEAVLDTDPGQAEVHAALAEAYLGEDLERSLAHARKALVLDPHHRSAFMAQIRALSLQRRSAELEVRLNAFRGANDLAPGDLARIQAWQREAESDPVHPGGTAPEAGRRLLAVYDLSAQPYSIGDVLTHVMGSLIEAEAQGLDRVDYAFISDPTRPPVDPVMRSLIREDNRHFHLMSILPVVQLSPRLGSVHVFDSFRGLGTFLDATSGSHFLWPSRADLEAGRYMYYEILKAVHRRHGQGDGPPRFRFNPDLIQWARSLFQVHAPGKLPVTVNLRNNPRFHAERNSNLPAWKAFFDQVADRVPVTFFITCAATEVTPELRACRNVIFAKDLHTNLVQDLALIQHSAFHIGASSGPATMCLFDTRPYHFFNSDVLPHLAHYGGALVTTPEGDLRFAFSLDLQRFGTEPETTETILARFQEIWTSREWVDPAGAGGPAPSSVKAASWLA